MYFRIEYINPDNFYPPPTLDYQINVGYQIDVGLGIFVKINKRRLSNKRRLGNFCQNQ